MPKYKCPNCGTIYTEAPRFCSTCGAEFIPLEEMPNVAPVAKQAEPAPAPAAQQPAPQPAAQPAPVEQQPVVEQPQPAPQPAEEEGVPFNLEDAREGNNNRVKARTIVGFIFAFLTLITFAASVLDVFMYGLTDIPLRLYIGIGSSSTAFVFAIVTLACTGKLSNVKRAKGLAIFSKIIGILFLILSIFMAIAWAGAYIGVTFGEMLEGMLGFNVGEYITNFLLSGKIK